MSGELYVKWAAETAVSLNTTVPWVMCAQADAPDSVVSVYDVHDGIFHQLPYCPFLDNLYHLQYIRNIFVKLPVDVSSAEKI